ncbi:MAG: hypothetical protein OHK0029_05820 [Armatimonadaceae bacterium]
MKLIPSPRVPVIVAALGMALLSVGCPSGKSDGSGGATSRASVPQPGEANYPEAVSSFFAGTIALATDDKDRREAFLQKATELAPGEPAAWANLALAYVVSAKPEEASAAITKAKALAPENAEVLIAEGFVLRSQGKFAEALERFRSAAEKDPQNLKVLWLVAEVADQARIENAEALRQEMYQRILEVRPDNVPTLIEAVRLAAETKATDQVRQYVQRLGERQATFTDRAKTQYKAIQAAAQSGDLRKVAIGATMLRNALNPTAGFRSSKREVSFNSEVIGEPVDRLLVMQNPPPSPAAPDTQLQYRAESVGGADVNPVLVAFAAPVDADGAPAIFYAQNSKFFRAGGQKALLLPAGSPSLAPRHFAPLDFDNDYLSDIAYAGPGGFRMFRQTPDRTFADVTASLKLPAPVTKAGYEGVWALDIEADGDLDLLLSRPNAVPTVLQNNGDDTFSVIPSPFPGLTGTIHRFAWADIDGDGDPDPVFADASGKLTVFSNERSGLFRARSVPEGTGNVVAVAVAEVTGDATVDLVVLQRDGSVVAYPDKDRGLGWQNPVTLAKAGVANPQGLFFADLDNNGGTDILVSGNSGSEVLLSDAEKQFSAAAIAVPMSVQGIADVNNDGLLDPVGVAGGKATQSLASGSKNYNWQSFTLKKAPSKAPEGSQINTFAIGGEVEMRAGLLYNKQPISQPQIHFGLGEYPKVDVARVIWPTGNAQSEFDLSKGTVVAEQRLGGSCPFLYAWDGTKMGFVTDCIWRSPLGLKINAQVTAGVTQTEDWVKVRGDQLAPKDGFYSLSITGELRETHFFDLVNLLVVDHPEDTDIFVDERFVPTQAPDLRAIPVASPQPVAAAYGTNGQDVSSVLRERDGEYLDDFGRGQYQGVTKDHWVEVEIGDDAPRDKPLYLIAHGWLHPTDSSINIALGQNRSAAPPQGLSLETPDASGKWRIAKPGLGFPEGKVKTIVLRIDDAFAPNAPRRVRLRTNLEIFWDQIRWAEGKPDAALKQTRLMPETVGLRYRGFSVVRAKDASSPELPVSYEARGGTYPRWRDLEGFHTRYGDITPLLQKVDDRYAMLNAGDEMTLRFKELPPPPAGWKRDFVVIGDGWCKDGNVNTAFGKTVMPYPAHNLIQYDTPPSGLENDPVFQRHPEDWQTYHTRYVTPEAFHNALLPRSGTFGRTR